MAAQEATELRAACSAVGAAAYRQLIQQAVSKARGRQLVWQAERGEQKWLIWQYIRLPGSGQFCRADDDRQTASMHCLLCRHAALC
jgi:hypothetical protein